MSKIEWIKRIIYFLLILVPLHFSISTPFINDVKFLDLGVGVFTIIFLYFFVKLHRRELSLLWDKIDLSIYIYSIIVIIGVILSDNPIQSLRNYFLFFVFIVFFYMGRNLFSKKDFTTIEKISLWTSTIASIYTIIQFYGYYFIFAPKGGTILSFFGNPNFAADFIAINTPIIVKYLVLSPGIGGILLTISYTALIMLGSRGALVGFAGGVLFFFFLVRKKGYPIGKPFLIFTLIVIIVTTIYATPNPINKRSLPIWKKLETTKEFIAKSEGQGSIKARITFWKVGLLMIKKHPLKGVAPGRYGYFYPFYQAELLKKDKSIKKHAYNAKRAHNEYLQVFSETGIFGFIAFLFILYFLLSQGLTKAKEDHSLSTLAFLSSLIAFLLHSLVSFPMHLAASMLYFAVFSSLIVGKGRKIKTVRSQAIIVIIYSLLIIGTAFMLSYATKAYIARMYLGKGKLDLLRSVRAENPDPLVKEGFRKILLANYFDPYDPYSYFYLAKVYQYGKRYEKAIEYYNKFSKMYSDFNGIFNRGKCYFEMGKIKEAIQYFEKLREIKPDYQDLYKFLGASYMRERDYKKAIEVLKEGLIYEEDKAPLYINLGICYKKLGDLEKAMEYMKKAKEIEPQNERIDMYIEDLKRMMERGSLPQREPFEVFGKKKGEIDKVKVVMKDVVNQIYREFGLYPEEKFRIVITSSSSEFERIAGISGFYGGAVVDHTIYFKPIPLIEKYDSLERIAKHEYIHILLNEMGEEKPLWVQEGFAIYTSDILESLKPEEFRFIPFSSFPHRGYSKNIYYNAYLKVFTLIDLYGKERFLEFLKRVDYYNEKEVFKEVFGITEEKLDMMIKNKIGGING